MSTRHAAPLSLERPTPTRTWSSMITGETFLLTAIGIVPGPVAGYWAAVAFMNSFSSDQFPIVAEVRP